ncbi:hypothetical protein [Nonomuraea dietziae]|uniref:hypothetical protein n=1 Tax=Nonomuraea dietziae TaxID=65515 RepID=UPI0033FCE2BB
MTPTNTPVDAPDTHSDDVHLLPIPLGTAIPRLADWAIPISVTGSKEATRLHGLALACIAITDDLTNDYDGTDELENGRRAARLRTYHSMLSKVMADIGQINLAVTANQAAAIADAATAIARPATVVPLDPAIIWDLLDQHGHGEHGGWTHDARQPDIECACGEAVFRFAIPAPAERP